MASNDHRIDRACGQSGEEDCLLSKPRRSVQTELLAAAQTPRFFPELEPSPQLVRSQTRLASVSSHGRVNKVAFSGFQNKIVLTECALRTKSEPAGSCDLRIPKENAVRICKSPVGGAAIPRINKDGNVDKTQEKKRGKWSSTPSIPDIHGKRDEEMVPNVLVPSCQKPVIAPFAGTTTQIVINTRAKPTVNSSCQAFAKSTVPQLQSSTGRTAPGATTKSALQNQKHNFGYKNNDGESCDKIYKSYSLDRNKPNDQQQKEDGSRWLSQEDAQLIHRDKCAATKTHEIMASQKSAAELLKEAKEIAKPDAPKMFEKHMKDEDGGKGNLPPYPAPFVLHSPSLSDKVTLNNRNMCREEFCIDTHQMTKDNEGVMHTSTPKFEQKRAENKKNQADGSSSICGSRNKAPVFVTCLPDAASEMKDCAVTKKMFKVSSKSQTILDSSHSNHGKRTVDLSNEREDAMLPDQISPANFFQVQRIKQHFVKRKLGGSENRKQFADKPLHNLPAKAATDKEVGACSIHYFCTGNLSDVVPPRLQQFSRFCHAPSKYPPSWSKLAEESFNSETARTLEQGVTLSEVLASEKDCLPVMPTLCPSSLEEWQRVAEICVQSPQFCVVGKQVPLKIDVSRLFWNPSPPKFACPTSYFKQLLCPIYQQTDLLKTMADTEALPAEMDNEGDDDDDEEEMRERLEERDHIGRVLSRTYGSEPALGRPGPLRSLSDLVVTCAGSGGARRQQEVWETCSSEKCEDPRLLNWHVYSVVEKVNHMLKPRKCTSEPSLNHEDSDFNLKAPSDFRTCMDELEAHKAMLQFAAKELQDASAKSSDQTEVCVKPRQKIAKLTPAEKAREAGLKYVHYPKKKKKKRHSLHPDKLEAVLDQLQLPPRLLTRCCSDPHLQSPRRKPHSWVLHSVHRDRRRPSLPRCLDFGSFADNQGRIPEDESPREWVRDIWNRWFDEVFPPQPKPSNNLLHAATGTNSEALGVSAVDKTDVEIRDASAAPAGVNTGFAELKPGKEDLEAEVERLSGLIEAQGQPSSFHFCRRGAVYRKLGRLDLAKSDLDTAIDKEVMLLDAYWHRHFIHLLLDNPRAALHDLNFILKHNQTRADAYRSRAEIHSSLGDIDMALCNYSQAIKYNSEDYESYFRRAEANQRRGDMQLAMQDYAQAARINPSQVEALIRCGRFHLKQRDWAAAIQDFTTLIDREPNNALHRTHRGIAYAGVNCYKEAIKDFTLSIRLDPKNWIGFYHRGCLLREALPTKALQDLSISVLLNNRADNMLAFLHRGMLYAQMGRWTQAICDFEIVQQMDRTVALAHMNLGLILLTVKEQYHAAIKCFTAALKTLPTCARAYVHRADAYHKVGDLHSALCDVTKAIHLQPTSFHLYLMRGQYLYEMNNKELAVFCLCHVLEMSQELGLCSMQQAIIQSFLKDHQRAIECLAGMCSMQPQVTTLALLGNIQLKAKQFQEAKMSFEQALHLSNSVNKDQQSADASRANIYFLLGLCLIEQTNFKEALKAFSAVLHIVPKHQEALYKRGICRLKLQDSSGLLDINRTLALNPHHIQAYLTRAAYYGMKGRFTKAIMNCNEVLRIQPSCVRAFLYRGSLKYCIKAYKLAVEDLSSAIYLDGSCSLAFYNRAICYQELHETDKAVKDYSTIALLGKQNDLCRNVMTNRGLLYFDKGDYQNAQQDFYAASKIGPPDPKLLQALGICYHRLGRVKEAVAAFGEATKADPFYVSAYVGRGNALMNYGHASGTRAAQRDYLRALHLDPLSGHARVNLAYSLQANGRFQKAWNHFTTAIELNTRCAEAFEGRAVVNLQMNSTFAALQDINTAVKLGKSAEVLTNRGAIHQGSGDVVSAMRDYQAAIVADPNYALAYYNAANVYLHGRQLTQALDYYDRVVELDPMDECAFLNRAIVRSLSGDATGALADFCKAATLSPQTSHIYFNRANLHCMLGQYKRAEADYTEALTLQPHDAVTYLCRAEVRGKLGKKEDAISDYKHAVEIQTGRKESLKM
ncbi:tetratricopeptide repeat protein 6 isoform X3 [Lampetra fluviatilis]